MFIIMIMIAVADIYSLLNNTLMLNCSSQMLVSFGLIYTRFKEPDKPRPFKVQYIQNISKRFTFIYSSLFLFIIIF